MKYIVKRDTGRGDIFEDAYETREEAEYQMEYMKAHARDFNIDRKNSDIWMEEVSMTMEDIEAIADEVGYDPEDEEAWMDYCQSAMADTSVNEDQVREKLAEFKRVEAEVNA